MKDLEGHLFVAHGTIQSVIHDAALIPVGQELRYRSQWVDLVGERPSRPDRWDERGFGRTQRKTPFVGKMGPVVPASV